MQFFNYKEMLYINYLNTNEGKGKAGFDSLNIPEPDKSYYSFLKALKPNDPLLLYSSEYSNCLQAILQNDTLSIPLIEDTPIEKWLDGVKKTMADLVGFDKGLFYDMLAANAYAKQFNDRVQPLSEKQKQNIQDYFKNSSFVEILLKKSEETEKVSALASGLKINETPTLPDGRQIEAWYRENSIKPPTGKLIDTIVSRYRGKVTVIDFWATWCAPCMSAISESRELKAEMKDRNVVFVYITNSSSPKETWQQKISGIGGEHYYLSNKRDWESITYSEKYGFKGIPTYLIFDAEGNLKHKMTAYPGNDGFRELIEDLL
jgi:thiol-disulfide isomerase/thioredoxin